MTQNELKKILDKENISYQEHSKWLIIDDKNNNIHLFDDHFKSLPEYLIFNNKGYVNLIFNNLKTITKNIIFSKNVNKIYIDDSTNIKLKYYTNYFKKINYLYTYYLNDNLIFEKLINMYCELNEIDKEYETPHICLTYMLMNINKQHIFIRLPKSFSSISSWI